MNKEAKNLVKKTAKIAGVTCIVLGGAALIASGAALKALTAGGKYLKDTVKKIIDKEYKEENIAAEATVAEASPENFVETEAIVAEESSEAEEVAAE